MDQLLGLLSRLDTKPFKEILQLKGTHKFNQFQLTFLRIQKSPGAHPASIGEISFNPVQLGFPNDCFHSPESTFAMSDFLIRRFHTGIERFAQQNRGKEGSGSFHILYPGQKMLTTDCVSILKDHVVLRFIISFPSAKRGGGSFDSHQAEVMFEQELSRIARYSFAYHTFNEQSRCQLDEYIRLIEDRRQIDLFLIQNRGVCFIPDKAVLPRKSGIDDRPLDMNRAIPFVSPDALAVHINLPGRRIIRGMMIKAGVTLITGGGFHGKSTLLQAVESGIYPHIPGDGRERIVTRNDAVTVRSEEGRRIEKVNISPFIRNLPDKTDSTVFSSNNASGSTSLAGGIMEALEAGSRLLLMDEDRCATNMLARDDLIEKIVPNDQEPIIPLFDRIRTMWENHGISTILVVGGLGKFMHKADTILVMNTYTCNDVTAKVRDLTGPVMDDAVPPFQLPMPRLLKKDNFNPAYINQRLNKSLTCRIKPLRGEMKKLEYGMDLIDMSDVPHIVHASQTMAIGLLIRELWTLLNEETDTDSTLVELIDILYADLEDNHLFALDHEYPGTLSYPRKFELTAAVNRMQSLTVDSIGKK